MPRPTFAPLALAPLAAGLLLVGCAPENDADMAIVADDHDDEHVHAEADHAHFGPHDGAIIELTADHSIHGELVAESPDDPARGRFYLLGPDLATPVTASGVEMSFEDPAGGDDVNLRLDPVGEPGADSAEWSFLRDRLPNGGEGELVGTVVVQIDGEDYEEEFEIDHDEHAGHDHD